MRADAGLCPMGLRWVGRGVARWFGLGRGVMLGKGGLGRGGSAEHVVKIPQRALSRACVRKQIKALFRSCIQQRPALSLFLLTDSIHIWNNIL